MRLASFLVSRQNPSHKAYRPPTHVRPDERLHVTAYFVEPAPATYAFEVFTQQPDRSLRRLGAFTGAPTPVEGGLVVIQGSLEPLLVPGWHRLVFRLDGEDLNVSWPFFVDGERGQRGRRYMGRPEPAVR